LLFLILFCAVLAYLLPEMPYFVTFLATPGNTQKQRFMFFSHSLFFSERLHIFAVVQHFTEYATDHSHQHYYSGLALQSLS